MPWPDTEAIVGGLRKPLRASGLALAVSVGLWAWFTAPLMLLAPVALFAVWLIASTQGRQVLAIAWMGIVTIPQRLGATSVVLVGIAGVVGVFVALQAMAEGFEATLRSAGDDDTAIVLRAGADAELSSGLDRAAVTLIAQAPGILRDDRDVPIASAEVVVVANLPKRSTGTDANVEVRGVGREVWLLRRGVHIIQGRRFKPGLRELIVGRGAQAQFRGATPGSVIRLNNQDWRVVGVFSSGDAHESELWGDAESVGAAYRRNGFQSVTARLVQPQVIERLAAALTHDPRLRVDVQTTRAYYGKQSQRLTQVIRGVGTVVVVIMALGAVFGALNTTYAAVAGRSLEIATLRALGFTAVPVVLAVMLETMALALAGGLLGAGVAWAAFNGYQVSTLGSNFSQVVFQFDVTPALLLQGVQWAVGIGFVGGFFPAVRAASLPVIHALRAQ
jgi:putative ABC transport system permease protein